MAGPPAKKTSQGARCILVVEDDTAVRELVVRALQSSYQVFAAKDGLDAAERLAEMPAAPALVICDVMMPRVDGFSFARMLRGNETMRAVPFLFLSAKSAPTDVLQGMALGARHYMTKPFKVHELVEIVERLVGKA
jgi:DNA-binding response OmpR family regulator